jgi:hypothetical protein
VRDAEGRAGSDGEAGPRDPALDELREAYESGQLIVFAGAGVSAAAGLPGWKRLVELLAERARSRKAPPRARSREAVSLCRAKLGLAP